MPRTGRISTLILLLAGCPEPVDVPPPPGPPTPGCVDIGRASLDFGVAPPGYDVFDVIRITYQCPDGLQHHPIQVLGAAFSAEQPFEVTRISDHTELDQGQSAFIEVKFRADVDADYRDTLTIETDVEGLEQYVIPARASVSGAILSQDTEAIDFGEVWAGCSRTRLVRLQNLGTRTATGFSLLPATGRTFATASAADPDETWPWTLPPGEERAVAVTYSPVWESDRDRDTLAFTVDAPAIPGVPISLEGRAAFWEVVTDELTWPPRRDRGDTVRYKLSQTVVPDTLSISVGEEPLDPSYWTFEPLPNAVDIAGNAPVEDGAVLAALYAAKPDDCEATR